MARTASVRCRSSLRTGMTRETAGQVVRSVAFWAWDDGFISASRYCTYPGLRQRSYGFRRLLLTYLGGAVLGGGERAAAGGRFGPLRTVLPSTPRRTFDGRRPGRRRLGGRRPGDRRGRRRGRDRRRARAAGAGGAAPQARRLGLGPRLGVAGFAECPGAAGAAQCQGHPQEAPHAHRVRGDV